MADIGEVEVERAPRRPRAERERVRTRGRARGRRPGEAKAGLALLGAALLAWAGTRAMGRPGKRRGGVGARVGVGAGDLGRGFVAGMAGTLAITTASTVDQLATEVVHARKEKRSPDLDLAKAIVSPWSFSAGVVEKVMGLEATDEEHERRLSVMAHWHYGSSWGLSLAAMRALGVRGLRAMGALLAGQLGAEMAIMPALKLFAGPSTWGRRAIVSSVYQHAIYAIAAVSTFEWLTPGDA